MSKTLIIKPDIDTIYSDISSLIFNVKNQVMRQMNNSVITLYWEIGKKLTEDVLQGEKAGYGKNIIGDLSDRLTAEYGKGFEKIGCI